MWSTATSTSMECDPLSEAHLQLTSTLSVDFVNLAEKKTNNQTTTSTDVVS